MKRDDLPIARINESTLARLGQDCEGADIFSVERPPLGLVEHRIVRSESVPIGEVHLEDGSVLDVSDMPQG